MIDKDYNTNLSNKNIFIIIAQSNYNKGKIDSLYPNLLFNKETIIQTNNNK